MNPRNEFSAADSDEPEAVSVCGRCGYEVSPGVCPDCGLVADRQSTVRLRLSDVAIDPVPIAHVAPGIRAYTGAACVL